MNIHITKLILFMFLTIHSLYSKECSKEPLSVRCNNAGNLIYSKNNKWEGQVGKYKGFAVFASREDGLEAMNTVTKYNIKKSKTVSKFVARYTNESIDAKHIKRYRKEIRDFIGRDYLLESDSELLLPLIVYLEGGQKAHKYFFGEKYDRTKENGRNYCIVQMSIAKHGIQRRSCKQTSKYSLRDVLMGNQKPNSSHT